MTTITTEVPDGISPGALARVDAGLTVLRDRGHTVASIRAAINDLPDTFLIWDSYLCVLAAVYGSYSNGAHELGFDTLSDEMSDLGFDASDQASYSELQAAWCYRLWGEAYR